MICRRCGGNTEAGKACPNCGTVAYKNIHYVPPKLTPVFPKQQNDYAPESQSGKPENQNAVRNLLQRKSFLTVLLSCVVSAVLLVSLVAVTVNSSGKQKQMQGKYQHLLSQYSQMTGQVEELSQNNESLQEQNDTLQSKNEELEAQLSKWEKESARRTGNGTASGYHLILIDTREISIPRGYEIMELSPLSELPDYEKDGNMSFLGWNYEPDGSGSYLKEVPAGSINNDLVLFAIWSSEETTSETGTADNKTEAEPETTPAVASKNTEKIPGSGTGRPYSERNTNK